MSLDICLIMPERIKKEKSSGIFIRENGQTIEISLQEWNERFLDREPVVFQTEEEETNCVFKYNITHNLGEMADKAGIYDALWRPYRLHKDYFLFDKYDDEMLFEAEHEMYAKNIISILQEGLKDLEDKFDYFKQFNPENGWGTYEGFVRFVEKYLEACIAYPEANIEVNR